MIGPGVIGDPVSVSPALDVLVALIPAVLAFGGAILGGFLARRSSKETDVWRRREETMRLLRWALERAASADPAESRMGYAVLEQLLKAELVQPVVQPFVTEIVASVMDRAETDAIPNAPIDDIDIVIKRMD